MKIKLVIFLFLMSVITGKGQNLWKKEGIKLPAPICYASHESYHSFVKPPAFNPEQLKSGLLKKANIEVTYIGFSPEAQQAFQYAVDIWQNLIYSPITIRVKATMLSLSKDVLGSCSPGGYYKNFNSTQIWDCYYPVALIEKMLGEEVNSNDEYDIVASFNKDFTNWYFGTDGKTPITHYDFASTVLHELTHGLGFSGFFYTDRGRGLYDEFSAAFDQSVEDKNGDRLINQAVFPNPSTALYQALTSGWLAFDTKLVEGLLPRLYAPTTWDDGSSIYHLDDATYPTGDSNSLMTPFAGKGEAIHDPGSNSLGIMYDMGWKSISIKHKQLKDVEFVSVASPINVDAQIESDYHLDSTKTYLYYLSGRFTKTDSVKLKATSVPLVFNAQFPQNLSGEVRYYFSATDAKKRSFKFPSNSPTRYLSFNIGPDKVAPVLKHEPIKYMILTSLSAKVDVEATDNMGIKSVYLEYFVNGGSVKTLALTKDTNDLYTANLIFPEGSVKDGDKVQYRAVAVDVSSNSNVGRIPLSGYNTFYIEGVQKPVEKYVNNFNTETHDFISTDFTISTVSGFDSPALNSAHPYLSPDTDDMNFNFTTILKYPIILKAGGKMSFDEIVLVEPGETGSKFGDENFWDYVVIEGSKNGGVIWKPLVDGYDSNLQKTWFNLFNSAMSGQNSTAVPTKSLFVKHEIDLLANGNFIAGDTIQIRFRLFSDPYSHGWGWIIDNLNIQDVNTGTNSTILSSGEVLLYPNPATGHVNLQIDSKENLGKFLLKAFNSSGSLVYNQSFSMESISFQTGIDVSKFIPGLYLFAIEPEKGQAVTRKMLIQ